MNSLLCLAQGIIEINIKNINIVVGRRGSWFKCLGREGASIRGELVQV